MKCVYDLFVCFNGCFVECVCQAGGGPLRRVPPENIARANKRTVFIYISSYIVLAHLCEFVHTSCRFMRNVMNSSNIQVCSDYQHACGGFLH